MSLILSKKNNTDKNDNKLNIEKQNQKIMQEIKSTINGLEVFLYLSFY